ncbi:MAG TPA: hotdog domain-containing protein [Nocardioidaceae bacterium]
MDADSPPERQDDWVPLRFRDLDGFGHVYHGEFLTLLDEARTRWFAEVGLEQPEVYVLARLEIDWVSPLVGRDRAVRVEFEVDSVGRTSVGLKETMYAADGRVVSRSRSVTVRWDQQGARSRELSPEERAGLEALTG